jgi:membrane protease YdiL (CAAX protease family)
LLWEEKNYTLVTYLLSLVAITGAVIIGNGLINVILRIMHIKAQSAAMDKMMILFRANKSLLFLTAFTAGVTEELIFRGYIQPRLELLFKNSWVAIIISSLLFGLLHYRYGTWFNVLGPFMMGLVFAFYYSRYRNIKLLILFHFLWDIMAISLNLWGHHHS